MKSLKFVLIPLLFFMFFASIVKPALAIDLWPFDNLWETVQCAADIDCTVRAASVAGTNFIVNSSVGKDFEELKNVDLEAMQRGEWNEGLASAISKAGGLAYQPVSSVKDYVRTEFADNLLNNPALAQTQGTKALSPVQAAWEGMRNIAYGFFALIMVAIGFMIIFQKQLPTRTVVTFTYALPRILLGLVLITFSFPLVALVIDMGVVFTSAVVINIFGDLFKTAASTAAGGVASIYSASQVSTLGSFLKGIGQVGITALPALLMTATFILVFLVVTGLAIVRLFIAYTYLLVYTVFSPVIFLAGTLPGQEGAITTFFKTLLSKTLVFPAILFLTLFAAWVASTTLGGATEAFFEDNLGNVVTGALSTYVGAFVALVILALAFVAPTEIDKALGVGGKKK